MDDTRLNRLQRTLAENDPLTRRGLAGLAVGALAAGGWGIEIDAKKRKKKKKKKKKKGNCGANCAGFTYEFVAKWGSSGSGNGQFNFPQALAVDSSGNVYVADTNNDRVQKFAPNAENPLQYDFVAKWGSSGNSNGRFDLPTGIAVDTAGNVYVADSGNNRVQKFNSGGTFLTKWGVLGDEDGEFDEPESVAVDGAGNVYVVDSFNARVQKFTNTGGFLAKWDYCDDECLEPGAVAVDGDGNFYVTELAESHVQKFASSGGFVTEWGSFGSGNGQFNNLASIAADADGNVFVLDQQLNRFQRFSSSGSFLAKYGAQGTGDGEFDAPLGIAVDAAGNVYVADSFSDRTQKFAPRPESASNARSTTRPRHRGGRR